MQRQNEVSSLVICLLILIVHGKCFQNMFFFFFKWSFKYIQHIIILCRMELFVGCLRPCLHDEHISDDFLLFLNGAWFVLEQKCRSVSAWSIVQCSAIQGNELQCSAVFSSAVLWTAV